MSNQAIVQANVNTMVMAHDCATDAYLILIQAIEDVIEDGDIDGAPADYLRDAVKQAHVILSYWL